MKKIKKLYSHLLTTVNKYIFYLKKAYNNPLDMWWFIQGEFRYFLYKNIPWLVRKHIKEQYIFRMGAALECTLKKSCISCGCSTPSLYFANKACSKSLYNKNTRIALYYNDRICFNKMLNKKEWKSQN